MKSIVLIEEILKFITVIYQLVTCNQPVSVWRDRNEKESNLVARGHSHHFKNLSPRPV
jgi:hypothetical protein